MKGIDSGLSSSWVVGRTVATPDDDLAGGNTIGKNRRPFICQRRPQQLPASAWCLPPAAALSVHLVYTLSCRTQMKASLAEI